MKTYTDGSLVDRKPLANEPETQVSISEVRILQKPSKKIFFQDVLDAHLARKWIPFGRGCKNAYFLTETDLSTVERPRGACAHEVDHTGPAPSHAPVRSDQVLSMSAARVLMKTVEEGSNFNSPVDSPDLEIIDPGAPEDEFRIPRSLSEARRNEPSKEKIKAVGNKATARDTKKKVGVNAKGMVDTGCMGKNNWHREWRAVVFRLLDLSKQYWTDQDPADVATAVAYMDARWEYVGPSPRVRESLEKYGKVIMKTEQHRLKKKWDTSGSNPNVPLPEHCPMTAEQWAKLVKIFMSENDKGKSENMLAMRHEVVMVNPFGCGRVGVTEAKAKAEKGSTPSKAQVIAISPQSLASEQRDGSKVLNSKPNKIPGPEDVREELGRRKPVASLSLTPSEATKMLKELLGKEKETSRSMLPPPCDKNENRSSKKRKHLEGHTTSSNSTSSKDEQERKERKRLKI